MSEQKPVIALLYDFDKTLCTKDMQEYKFIPDVGMDSNAFWKESNDMARREKMDGILAYMYVMLKRANAANKPIRREDFVALGKNLEFFPGVVDWFARINRAGKKRGVDIEHYIISSGLGEIIEGSSICKHFTEVYACEFHYNASGVADWPKNLVNYTTKTQFLFRVNKGIPDLSNDRDLNNYTPEDERRVPFRNMLYIGDGLTDVPCMRLVKSNGGFSIAVYTDASKNTVGELLAHNRVDFLAPADYSEGGALDIIVQEIIQKMSVTDSLRRRSIKQNKALRPQTKKP